MCNHAQPFFKKGKPNRTRGLQSKKRLIIEIIAGLGLLATTAFKIETESTATASIVEPSKIERVYEEEIITAPKTVTETVEEYFHDIPLMKDIAWCESRMRQFNPDGSIFRGKVNPNDVGVMQINTYYHLETSKKLGMDIFTLDGNMAYAKYLFEKEGSRPWKSSSPCWKPKSNLVVLK